MHDGGHGGGEEAGEAATVPLSLTYKPARAVFKLYTRAKHLYIKSIEIEFIVYGGHQLRKTKEEEEESGRTGERRV